jgi:hypothetical protein
MKLLVYGDCKGFWPGQPVLTWVAEDGDDRYIADFSEDGLFVSAGHAQAGAEVRRMTIEDALKDLDPNTPVDGWLNLQSYYLKEHGIRTVEALRADIARRAQEVRGP